MSAAQSRGGTSGSKVYSDGTGWEGRVQRPDREGRVAEARSN